MRWKKDGTGWICLAGPDAVFTMKVQPKGDGRWTWTVWAKGGESPLATGVGNSLGGAKMVSENFATRSGKI